MERRRENFEKKLGVPLLDEMKDNSKNEKKVIKRKRVTINQITHSNNEIA
jgi:hypothetical protein